MLKSHYDDVIMMAIASQITSLTIVYSAVYSGAHQRKHQSSASLAFVWGIHRGPVNSPHKWPVTRKMFSFDDVIMTYKTQLSGIILGIMGMVSDNKEEHFYETAPHWLRPYPNWSLLCVPFLCHLFLAHNDTTGAQEIVL